MKVEILYSKRFKKQFKRLPKKVIKKLIYIENIFRYNPFSPELKTHKLHGKLKNEYAFSVNYEYRVIFTFIDSNTVFFLEIGTHEIYK